MTEMASARHAPGNRIFWTLWAVDALVALIFVVFFLIGLVDGSVSSFNMVLWLSILFILGSTLLGSYHLRMAGFRIWALLVVLVVAIPGLLAGIFFLAVLMTQTSWN